MYASLGGSTHMFAICGVLIGMYSGVDCISRGQGQTWNFCKACVWICLSDYVYRC